MTITEFLTARLDEDEAVAREVQEKVRPNERGRVDYWEDATGSAASIIWDVDYNQGGYTITAARVLADVAAKRAIVASWRDPFGNWSAAQADAARAQKERTLVLLASVYADHPDWREEWRP